MALWSAVVGREYKSAGDLLPAPGEEICQRFVFQDKSWAPRRLVHAVSLPGFALLLL
jgi:hypothetical protein